MSLLSCGNQFCRPYLATCSNTSAITDAAVPKWVMSIGQYLFSWKHGTNTKSLARPHKKKSHGVRSEDLGGATSSKEGLFVQLNQSSSSADDHFSTHVWLYENWEVPYLTGRNAHSSSKKQGIYHWYLLTVITKYIFLKVFANFVKTSAFQPACQSIYKKK